MLDRSQAKIGPAALREGGHSLIWVLFPSVVLVTIVVFMVVQLFDPSKAAMAYADRVDLSHLATEIADNLPWILILMTMMMAGIFAALHLGLRPLRRISDRAGEIGPATVSQRLPLEATPREIAPLVVAFNAALDRLEAGLRAQRDFSANAAHELRTPLATLRAQLESLLEPDERRHAVEEFDRLSRLIAQLLALAEADGGDAPAKQSFDLVETTRDVTRDMAVAIVASGRNVAFDSVPPHWECWGAPGLVEVALRNLLENAMRHTPGGADILVEIDVFGRLAVTDTGPGVPADFQDRLFQRFSKADVRGVGAGLGLSIVSRVMDAHGGEARLDPSAAGARFVLDFSRRGHGGREPRP